MNVFFWKTNKPLAILLILILFQLILISIQVPLGDESSFFKKILIGIFSPVKHGVVFIYHGIGKFWDNYFFVKDSSRENARLKTEVLYLRHENLFLKNTIRKYTDEKAIIDKVRSFYTDFLVAGVIGVDLNNYYKTIIIDRGTLDGIKKNMVVLDRNGYLVGRIIKPISFKESRVQLITDNDIGFGVYTETGAPFGILTGDGEGRCLLKYILKTNSDVQIGQDVLTSGQDDVFPRNLQVGRIISVEEVESLFKIVKVRQFFRFKDLDRLVVLLRNMKDEY